MDQDHGDIECSLDAPEVVEEAGHLVAPVFVEAMKADQRVEQEQPRSYPLHGLVQRLRVRLDL